MADMQRSLAAEQDAHRALVSNLDQNLDQVNDYLHQDRGTDAASQRAFAERQALIDSFNRQHAQPSTTSQQQQQPAAVASAAFTNVLPNAQRASAEVSSVVMHTERAGAHEVLRNSL